MNSKTNAYTASGTHSHEDQIMKKSTARRALPAALALALTASVSTTAQAIEFSSGELTGSFDTTVSYGVLWRASDLDTDNVGKAYLTPGVIPPITNAEQRLLPGRWSVNNDDGNRNYADGGEIVSNTIKFVSELDISWRNYGVFTRFLGFYDFHRQYIAQCCRIGRHRPTLRGRFPGCGYHHSAVGGRL